MSEGHREDPEWIKDAKVPYGSGLTEQGHNFLASLAPKFSKCCNIQAVTSRKFGAGHYECLKCGKQPCELL